MKRTYGAVGGLIPTTFPVAMYAVFPTSMSAAVAVASEVFVPLDTTAMGKTSPSIFIAGTLPEGTI